MPVAVDDPALRPDAWTSGLPDLALRLAQMRAGINRRAYWQCKYYGGRVISEYDRCCPKHTAFEWTELPRKNLVAIRLVCPNKQVALLGNTEDASDRIFQFKCAMLAAGLGRATTAHVVGMVQLHREPGACAYAAWIPSEGRLRTGYDNVFNFAFNNVGRLSFDVMGIKP